MYIVISNHTEKMRRKVLIWRNRFVGKGEYKQQVVILKELLHALGRRQVVVAHKQHRGDCRQHNKKLHKLTLSLRSDVRRSGAGFTIFAARLGSAFAK